MSAPLFDLLLITDPRAPRGVVEDSLAALSVTPPGRLGLLVRVKEEGAPIGAAALAEALLPSCRDRGAALLIHGDLALALALGAAGAHLPEGSEEELREARSALGPAALVGASRHDREGLLSAARAGASYATLSPLFEVPGKAPPLGLGGLSAALEGVPLPIFALGGIRAEGVPAALRAGARGVAVQRAIYRSVDPREALLALLRALDE